MTPCPSCGASAPDGARFCPECGSALTVRTDERRIVTVLFGDLVGFTSLAEGRDPEHVKNLVDRCFERLAGDVTAFGGRVDKILGDAIVALFGAPVAHEDDAERAVRAALRMQESLGGFAAETGSDVRMRIGVNTGEVLVGALRAGGDYTAMGDVVNSASRLQEAAEPGRILVGPATHEATRNAVRYEPVGPVDVRGREESVLAWAAVEALGPPGTRRRARTPLIGRKAELGMLWHAIGTTVEHRRPHLVLLIGEAGVGKTRLAEEAEEIARTEHGASVLQGRCLPYGEANPWWPLAEAVRGACGISPSDGAEEAVEKCRRAITELLGPGSDEAERKRIVDGLLYVMGYVGPLHDVEPARARDEAFRSVLATVQSLGRQGPVLVVLSELHWADDLVLELIDRGLERMRELPVVLVGTARPELHERWTPRPGRYNMALLNLDPLDRDAAAELLDVLLAEPPDPTLRETILERSGGNPLFLEELAALIGEAGPGDVHPTSPELPATLRGIVAARLDALDDAERSALEDAAVVGRRGSLDALGALISSRGGGDPEDLVQRLAGRDLLTVRERQFEFKSDLVRDVAYGILTKAERARRHAALGGWLEEEAVRTGRSDELIERIAHHYGVAAELVSELGAVGGVPEGIRERALDWLRRAATRAEERETTAVSVHVLDQALRLVGPEEDAIRRELQLARARGRASLRDLAGARADVEELLADADRDGDRVGYARALTVLGDVQAKESDLPGSASTLDRAVDLWRQLGDRGGEADALRFRGLTSLFAGELEAAERATSEALDAFRSVGDRRGEAWATQNLAWIAFYQGDHVRAEERLQEAQRIFTEIGDFGGQGWALGLLGYVRYYVGDLEYAAGIAEVGVDWTLEMGDRWAHGMMLNLLALVRLWQGRTLESLALAGEANRLFEAIEDPFGQVQSLMPLSWSMALTGRAEDAVQAADRALAVGREGAPNLMITAFMNRIHIALQLGEAEAAVRLVETVPEGRLAWEEFGEDQGAITHGLALLQLGRTDEAVEVLERVREAADEEGTLSYACCVLALAYAAGGRPDAAVEAAGHLGEMGGGTYLDRIRAHLARGLAHAQVGRAAEAEEAFRSASAIVDASDDRLNRALVRLARARALEALGSSEAADSLAEARAGLDELGVPATGWDELFRRAVRPAAGSRME